MVQSPIDYIHKEIKFRGFIEKLKSGKSVKEKVRILNDAVISMNITKCELADLESNYQNATLYLTFLLQSEDNIDFGVCPHYKMWYNRNGEQNRCRFNTGPTQVNCKGLLKKILRRVHHSLICACL